MTPVVATEDLIDAQSVADILGLSHRNTVSQYQRRYEGMPRPAVDLGGGRVKLWLRPEIRDWAADQIANGRTRRKRSRDR
jgi:hypothetical protein